MKRIAILTFSFATIATAACNSEPDQQHNPATELKTKEDSLYHDVMEGHNAAMPKMGKIKGYQGLVKLQLDSISKLPAKDRQTIVVYKASLDSLLESLQYAEMAMNTWMEEFVPDSASDNRELRLQYLESEKRKVLKVKENIFSSLEKAKEMLRQ